MRVLGLGSLVVDGMNDDDGDNDEQTTTSIPHHTFYHLNV